MGSFHQGEGTKRKFDDFHEVSPAGAEAAAIQGLIQAATAAFADESSTRTVPSRVSLTPNATSASWRMPEARQVQAKTLHRAYSPPPPRLHSPPLVMQATTGLVGAGLQQHQHVGVMVVPIQVPAATAQPPPPVLFVPVPTTPAVPTMQALQPISATIPYCFPTTATAQAMTTPHQPATLAFQSTSCAGVWHAAQPLVIPPSKTSPAPPPPPIPVLTNLERVPSPFESVRKHGLGQKLCTQDDCPFVGELRHLCPGKGGRQYCTRNLDI
mmetsp:Transcript_17576/g.26059  ORF Transcript_17576/g.26059 Transcript_17576/m.26059 type:complete len:269 (-) Transcript_17576:63-869(-)